MEHRACLSPEVCKKLIDAGFQITVECDKNRIFEDAEYSAVGCRLVPGDSWRTAPSDAIITGLKELPENDLTPLPHTHIMFAHCYKRQGGWKDVLSRFSNGKGLLYDLEFLQDASGRRVAAFGFYAGFTGSAVGIDAWCHQQLHPGTAYPEITPYPNEDVLIAETKAKLAKIGKFPKVMVMGALGRCGSGAVSYARKAGIPEENIIKWDMAETAKGGPFQEIIDADIFVNCIYLSSQIPAFITQEQIDGERQLSVIVDVSCDTTNPFNPIPIYNVNTTFDKPLLDIETKNPKPLQLCSIDHLPTMLPREASNQFATDLLPTLMQLPERDTAPVWTGAEALYNEKVASMATTD
ncbi:Formate/glycerate dehydrogenase catalytic domain-like protein [Linderina pennispora]|uniref:Saccharopine dehydrogenase [NAD(+), L-lysine-forming] n=1 Tax=Linderina pennispora TaxID=61395 RepID=A0A1Y1VXJ5_9FUNG|nr:Formate/glycerate dehydrogenase catalytic domain-like protein [Linderina pennispora]ORX65977.1 Formate/glycerate dehydrogenase catalytic domain-like protein [Linderina pennispora]